MLRESSYIELGLGPWEAVSLTRTAGWELTCVSGRLWLTEEGGGDVWLLAGDDIRLAQPGRTVIEAAGEGAGVKLRRRRVVSPAPLWRALLRQMPRAHALPARLCRAS